MENMKGFLRNKVGKPLMHLALALLLLLPAAIVSCDFLRLMQTPGDPVFDYSGKLIAQYLFDGDSADTGGNGYDLLDVSTNNPANLITTTDRFGGSGAADTWLSAENNNVSQIYTKKEGTDLETDVFTFTFWVQFYNTDQDPTLIMWGVSEKMITEDEGREKDALELQMSSDENNKNFRAELTYDDYRHEVYSSETLSADTWYFFAVTADSLGNVCLFQDGEKMGWFSLSGEGSIEKGGYLYLPIERLDGAFDDIRIYDYPMSSRQIEEKYKEESP